MPDLNQATYSGSRGFQPTYAFNDKGELQATNAGLGFRRFWQGRPELGAGVDVNYDWRVLDRPPIIEGSGPMGFRNRTANRFANRAQSKSEQIAQAHEAAAEEDEEEEATGGLVMPESRTVSNVRRGAEPPLSQAQRPPYSQQGALRPGTQFLRFVTGMAP